MTENGFGKRTGDRPVPQDEPRRQGRRDDQAHRGKGALAGALVVREHQELVFISQSGMVQRTGVRGISRYGRALAGRAGHEHQGRRRRQRGRAGRWSPSPIDGRVAEELRRRATHRRCRRGATAPAAPTDADGAAPDESAEATSRSPLR